jgi:murein L,D-transpeptidase YcbB/YkuD
LSAPIPTIGAVESTLHDKMGKKNADGSKIRSRLISARISFKPALLHAGARTLWTHFRARRIFFSAVVVALCLNCRVRNALATDSSPVQIPQTGSVTNPSPQAGAELGALIQAGKLPDLRWPNFSDYQADVGRFYQAGGYSLAWTRNNQATPQAVAMIQFFKQASLKGFNSEDYDGSRWDERLAKLQSSASRPSDTDLVHFDLALTVCTMRYISDLHIGRINPQHFKFGLDVGPKKYDLPELLKNQVIQTQDVAAVINEAEPPYAGYRRAEAALANYLKLAGMGDGEGLPIPNTAVRPGGSYPGMPQLIWRLHQLGDLASDTDPPADSVVYQGAVVEAVKHFQQRHGLGSDGMLGKGTISELNMPLGYRVWQLQLTLERYRWLPPNFPQPPLVVNIPEFRLRTLRRQPAEFLSMNVVVGKAYGHQTPVFAQDMQYVIFRPYWNVPPSIQRSELVPKVRRDRNYLASHGFEVVTNGGQVVTDGYVTDDVLDRLGSGAFSIRQKPGPKNALGLVKFIFPNSHNVYLHSTPAPELFSRPRRDFSHGCIRVQDPVALAAWVLRDNPGWDVDRVRAVMNGDQTTQVNLAHPIPVLILYSTAVVEPDNEVRFFDDIYGQDSALKKALAAGYPYPG